MSLIRKRKAGFTAIRACMKEMVMVISKWNYSERLNSLQRQTCNGHPYRRHARVGNHFGAIPSHPTMGKFGPKEHLLVKSLKHLQLLVHMITLDEPTHNHFLNSPHDKEKHPSSDPLMITMV